MINKKLAFALLLSAFAALPAHAISEHYRQQLERSGCTQVTESEGICDIHKTRGQNQAASEAKARTMATQTGAFDLTQFAHGLVGKDAAKSAKQLKAKGFRPSDETPYLFWSDKEQKSVQLVVDKHINTVSKVIIK